jgi:hypothetical protein
MRKYGWSTSFRPSADLTWVALFVYSAPAQPIFLLTSNTPPLTSCTINTFNTLNTIRMANRVALNKASERVCTFSLIVNVLVNLLQLRLVMEEVVKLDPTGATVLRIAYAG